MRPSTATARRTWWVADDGAGVKTRYFNCVSGRGTHAAEGLDKPLAIACRSETCWPVSTHTLDSPDQLATRRPAG